jgi:hypothetical protein
MVHVSNSVDVICKYYNCLLFLFAGSESLEPNETLVGETLVTGKSQAEFVTPKFATDDDFTNIWKTKVKIRIQRKTGNYFSSG